MINLRRSIQVLARRVPSRVRRLVKRFLVPGFLLRYLYPGNNSAVSRPGSRKIPASQQLSRAMVSGFGAAAAKKLEAITLDRSQPAAEVAAAARALAEWHRYKDEHERALYYLVMRRLAASKFRFETNQLVLESDTLTRLGRGQEAIAITEAGLAKLGEISELCFCAANMAALGEDLPQSDRDRLRLMWISKPLVAAGFVPIVIRDPSRPLGIDNVAAFAEPNARAGAAKISVLMPAYNAQDTIGVAIEGVLKQSWTNLELVIVDDGSSDATWSIIKSYMARDERIVALKLDNNRGAYPARNAALRQATGDFITVNDADDWSHPERLAVQASHLTDNPESICTISLVRVHPDMRVHVRTNGLVVMQNYSSLAIRRERLLQLGGWDEARVGSDSEMFRRLMSVVGEAPTILYPRCPLSFCLLRPQNSLSTNEWFGLGSLRYGARREYIESNNYWLTLEAAKPKPDFALNGGARRFPIPTLCKLGVPRPLHYDVLLVSDFSLTGNRTAKNVTLLEAGKRLGLRFACLHWPHLDSAGRDIEFKIRELLHQGVAQSVVAGEQVQCKLVIVYPSTLLEQLPDSRAEVRTEAAIVVSETPKIYPEDGRSGEIQTVLENARSAFGVTPTLAPAHPGLEYISFELIQKQCVSHGD